MDDGVSVEFAAARQEALGAASAVLEGFARLNAAKGEAEVAFAALPRFVRGFAESAVSAEILRQTGQGLPAWAATIEGLTGEVTAARAILERVGDEAALDAADRERLRRVAGEVERQRAGLGRLLRCMEDAPPKVERVPRQFLHGERRRLALDNLRAQTQALQDALGVMPSLEGGLSRVAEAG
ncbi:hypothetical protein DAETH_31680 [Deinococcus aetherius]|uniref:Uncharacterized protein n=1 Tax=Deinococcus aetherius TaxID=200252 RepID=A0ABN6RMW2_9DEIO|nr:hypothetical protein [Deinococcus aetherius]BDP43199.1 hypothetical protein DAETH_31680 [Deinococcus aetherius]